MSGYFKNENDWYRDMEAELLDNLKYKLPQLQILGQEQMTKAYTTAFGRNPVDTGGARDNSFVNVEVMFKPAPYILLRFYVEEKIDYAIYFLEPLQERNPNYKYGTRNTIKWARDKTASLLGIK